MWAPNTPEWSYSTAQFLGNNIDTVFQSSMSTIYLVERRCRWSWEGLTTDAKTTHIRLFLMLGGSVKYLCLSRFQRRRFKACAFRRSWCWGRRWEKAGEDAETSGDWCMDRLSSYRFFCAIYPLPPSSTSVSLYAVFSDYHTRRMTSLINIMKYNYLDRYNEVRVFQ